MDPTTFAPADWAALTSSVLKIAALAGLALSVGLALALLLTFLFGSPASADVERAEPRVTRPLNTVAPAEPWSAPAERLEPALVTAPARPGAATADPAGGVGLSPTDLIALRALRERVHSGEIAEARRAPIASPSPTGSSSRATSRARSGRRVCARVVSMSRGH